MFEVRIKRSTPESRAAEEKAYNSNPPSFFQCESHPNVPRGVWISLIIFSAVWFAVAAGFICILFSKWWVIPCAALLWIILVLCVRHNIANINSVDTLSTENEILTIRLANGEVHTYKTDSIKAAFRRVRNANKNRPVLNGHFKLTVTSSGKKTEYDVLASDETRFKAFVSNLQK